MSEKEILNAIKNDKFYGFVAENYYKMSVSQLKDLILELYYIVRHETIEQTKESATMFNEKFAEYLVENKNWEE